MINKQIYTDPATGCLDGWCLHPDSSGRQQKLIFGIFEADHSRIHVCIYGVRMRSDMRVV